MEEAVSKYYGRKIKISDMKVILFDHMPLDKGTSNGVYFVIEPVESKDEEGISPMLSMNIHKWYRNPNEEKLWRPVLAEVTFTKGSCGSVKAGGAGAVTGVGGRTVVITGAITGMTRKQMTEVLTLMGATVCDSVSRNTDYLIVGSNPGGKKLGAAMQNGTRIIPESEFIRLLSSQQ